MKKTLFLCLVLMAATFGFAQQQLATLNHNDSITVYYGASALSQAHAAAVNGDIITLSPGSFNSVTITKAVTIRGAGIYIDTITGTLPTNVTGNFLILNPEGSTNSHIIIEGINFTGSMMYSTTRHPEFIKCRFTNIAGGDVDSTSHIYSATFVNCIIEALQMAKHKYRWMGYYQDALDYNQKIISSNFVNSVIMNIYLYYHSISYSRTIDINYSKSNDYVSTNGTNNSFTNCIINLSPAEVGHYTINNSILYTNAYDSTSSLIYNSIGINTDSSANYFASSILQNQNLCNHNSFSDVFKYFMGSYNGTPSFELQDSIANTKLGSDSTQIGIYGGPMPFNPRVSGLIIRRLDVARRTTVDGKLSVDIEVVNDESIIHEE